MKRIRRLTYSVMLAPALQQALLLGVPFLLAIPSLQFWRRLTPRLGPRRTWIAVNLAWLPGLVVILLARDIHLALLGMALVAPGFAGYLMLFIVQLSEITDYDAQVTGQYRQGAYVGTTFMVMRLAYSVQALLFGALLAPSGYVAGAAAQPEAAVNAIRLLMGGAPMVACLISAVCLYFMRVPRTAAMAGAPRPAEG